MAHQIKDEKQEYQYGSGFTTPAGHEVQYYDTPDNERPILKHASGSHIEFKADGSVIIKSLKDLHTHSSIVSSANDGNMGAGGTSDVTTNFIGTNYTIDVTGTLKSTPLRISRFSFVMPVEGFGAGLHKLQKVSFDTIKEHRTPSEGYLWRSPSRSTKYP